MYDGGAPNFDGGESHYNDGPYCPVCHCFWTHGPRCEGIGWHDGEGERIEENWYVAQKK